MKRILSIVSYTFLPAKTGGQKSIDTFYQNLCKYFSLVCVGTEDNDSGKAVGYKVLKLFSSSPLRYINPFNLFVLRNIVKKEQPDYLQLEHPYLGWLAVLLKKNSEVKLIVRSHNIEGLRFKNLGKWWWKILIEYEGWVHRNADINYFISDVERLYAIEKFKLSSKTSFTITFGIDQIAPPTEEERHNALLFLSKKYKIDISEKLILFNGAFNYAPNINALYNLVQKIFPLIKKYTSESYKLIICGKDIPEELTSSNTNNDVIFAGFVPDINPYLKGATIFVNPITEGGGIKTKLVEALGFNLNCVSFETGAIGVSKELCGEKLIVVEDDNNEKFAKAIVQASTIKSNIRNEFYNQFSYQKIMEKIKSILN